MEIIKPKQEISPYTNECINCSGQCSCNGMCFRCMAVSVCPRNFG